MSFPQGIDFRSTAAFVTDPTNYTSETLANSVNGVNYPTTTPQGNTVGWETAGFNVLDTRDRSTGVDVRVAGINFVGAGLTATYRIDLPATGTYGIQAAFGDQGSAQGPFTIQLKDGTSVFATPVNNASTSAADDYYSANGTQRIGNAAWATNNPNAGSGADEITNSFTSTIFRITASGTGIALLASLFIRSAGGGSTETLSGSPTIAAFTSSASSILGHSLSATDTMSSFLSAASAILGHSLSAADLMAAFISSGLIQEGATPAQFQNMFRRFMAGVSPTQDNF